MTKLKQYECLKEVLERINSGWGYISISAQTGCIRLDEVIDTEEITKRIKGDIMMTLRTVRKELIDELVAEHNAEIGVDTDSDWAIEPFPIGTPKSDHRRCGDTDDGK